VHPIFSSRLRFALYLGGWFILAPLVASLLFLLRPRPFAEALAFAGPLTLFYASACLSAWWVCRAHPLGGPKPVHTLVTVFSAAVQASAVWVAAGAVWGAILAAGFGIDPGRPTRIQDLILLGMAGIPLYLLSVMAHYMILTFESARAAERRVLESQVTAREAELRALRAQLNPHFLFNSLNSISALAAPDPEAARRMCQLLGDFLRQSLSLGGRERVTLGEELALADRYLAIEQVRFGARLGVDKLADEVALRCLVPPLLLQPLVENAVKHGVADRVEGGIIRIAAHRRGDALVVEVENPRDPDAPPRRGQGLGLENVRARLDALDRRLTRMDVERMPDRFRVVLTMPASDGEEGRDGR
jgi:two-component system, LytTR family, sensor histidine kinase AlgZ